MCVFMAQPNDRNGAIRNQSAYQIPAISGIQVNKEY